VYLIFSILASYSRRYSYSKIDSPLSFTMESRCSSYRLLRRVETPRVVYYGESPRIINCKSSPHRLLRRVVTPRIVYYAELQLKWAADRGESKLCVSFTMGSHHPHQLFSKSIPDLWKFAECKVIFLSNWNFQKSMQLKCSTNSKNFVVMSIILNFV